MKRLALLCALVAFPALAQTPIGKPSGGTAPSFTALATSGNGLKLKTGVGICWNNTTCNTTAKDVSGVLRFDIATGKSWDFYTNNVLMGRIADGGFGSPYGALWLGTYTYSGSTFVILGDSTSVVFNTPGANGIMTFGHANDNSKGQMILNKSKLGFTHPTGATAVGTATLVSGTVTVTTTTIATGDQIFLSLNTPGGTRGTGYAAPVASIVNATSFVINAVAADGTTVTTDTSTVNYWIVNGD